MLKRTFCHLPSIGTKIEERLWSGGITSWEQFLEHTSVPGISPKRKQWLDLHLMRSIKALEEDDLIYFAISLPQREQWRLFPLYKQKTLFLDIETTGLNYTDRTTVVGLSDIDRSWALVRDRDLTHDAVADVLGQYDIMVTFNGRSFDVPFLDKEFPGMNWPPVHLDLRYLCSAVGLRGGQKRIEVQLGLARGEDVANLTGFDAVRLWRRWESNGDSEALDTLLEYNMEDVENMKVILSKVIGDLEQRYLDGI